MPWSSFGPARSRSRLCERCEHRGDGFVGRDLSASRALSASFSTAVGRPARRPASGGSPQQSTLPPAARYSSSSSHGRAVEVLRMRRQDDEVVRPLSHDQLAGAPAVCPRSTEPCRAMMSSQPRSYSTWAVPSAVDQLLEARCPVGLELPAVAPGTSRPWWSARSNEDRG